MTPKAALQFLDNPGHLQIENTLFIIDYLFKIMQLYTAAEQSMKIHTIILDCERPLACLFALL